MIMDPHKAVMEIMKKKQKGSAKDAPKSSEIPKEMDDGIDAKTYAVKDILAAVHSKSERHLLESLTNFFDLHMMDRADEDSPDL